MKAYLERYNGEWLDDFVYSSRRHLVDMGFEIIPFDGLKELDKLKGATTNDVCFGSVQATKHFFDCIKVMTPNYLGYPKSIKSRFERKIVENKLGNIKEEYPFFIKPLKDVKLFTGTVIDDEKDFQIFKNFLGNKINNDTEVIVSEVINIRSEFRCFVFENELKGIQFYQGDFASFPDILSICHSIWEYKNAPIAYTMDVGVVVDDRGSSQKTVIIEINDMWAIGSYGFDSKLYTKMCVRRMREIIKNNKKTSRNQK
jgi:hypothetical protein